MSFLRKQESGSLLPLSFAPRCPWTPLQKDMNALFIRGNDIRPAVAVDVDYLELGSNAGVVIDYVHDKLDLALLETA